MVHHREGTILLPLLLIALSLMSAKEVVASRRLLRTALPTVVPKLHKAELPPLPTVFPTLPKPELPPLPKAELPTLPKPELPALEKPQLLALLELEAPKLSELPSLPHLPELPKPTLPTIIPTQLPKDISLPTYVPISQPSFQRTYHYRSHSLLFLHPIQPLPIRASIADDMTFISSSYSVLVFQMEQRTICVWIVADGFVGACFGRIFFCYHDVLVCDRG